MSTTSKAFSYVFNTMNEDHKVAKVLRGWKPNESVSLADLSLFDAQTQDIKRDMQDATYQSLSDKKLKVNQSVLDVLTAYLVMYTPLLKEADPKGPAVKRLETRVLESVRTLADLLAMHLATSFCATKHNIKDEEISKKSITESEKRKTICHQAPVVDHYI